MPRPPAPPHPERYSQAWRFDDPAWLTQGGWDTLGFLNFLLRESEYGGASAQNRNLKSEARSTKSETNSNGEMGQIQNPGTQQLAPTAGGEVFMLRAVGSTETRCFEFWIWDLFGISRFEFRVSPLRAPIQWTAGQWHQVALVWSGGGPTVLYLDGLDPEDGTLWTVQEYAQPSPFPPYVPRWGTWIARIRSFD